MRKTLAALALFFILPFANYLHAESPQKLEKGDNARLLLLHGEGQADRAAEQIDWTAVTPRDEARSKETLTLLSAGGVNTSNDYYRAALIFQHGQTVDEARLAYSLAWLSHMIDRNNKDAAYLSALAWDRMLMRQNKPQWYGSQFVRSEDNSKWVLYPVDETAATDADRASFGVIPLSKAQERLEQLNR